jgi:hypothetical protein
MSAATRIDLQKRRASARSNVDTSEELLLIAKFDRASVPTTQGGHHRMAGKTGIQPGPGLYWDHEKANLGTGIDRDQQSRQPSSERQSIDWMVGDFDAQEREGNAVQVRFQRE